MAKNLNALCSTAESRITVTRKNYDTVNLMIKQTLSETGMYRWELADILGCSVETVARKLRHELPVEEQHRICDLIRKASSHD